MKAVTGVRLGRRRGRRNDQVNVAYQDRESITRVCAGLVSNNLTAVNAAAAKKSEKPKDKDCVEQ